MEKITKSPNIVLGSRPAVARLLFDYDRSTALEFHRKIMSIEVMGAGRVRHGDYLPSSEYLNSLSDFCMIDFRIDGIDYLHGVAVRDTGYSSWTIMSYMDTPAIAKVAATMLSIFDAQSYKYYREFFVQVDGDTFDSLDSNGIVVRDLKNDKTYWYEYNG